MTAFRVSRMHPAFAALTSSIVVVAAGWEPGVEGEARLIGTDVRLVERLEAAGAISVAGLARAPTNAAYLPPYLPLELASCL